MLDRLALYDTLYLLAAGDGRQEALFGSSQALARKAFSRSLMGDGFPTIWFEVPLSGKPRFDLHVAASRSALRPGVRFAPGAGGGYDGLFRWYAEEESGGAGLAFAYDVSEGRIDMPAVHVNVNETPLSDMSRFFELAASAGAAEHFESFAARLPSGWRVWYAGFHPGRPDTPVRVDCFVDNELKATYAHSPELLERHLHGCGFTATGDGVRRVAGLVAGSPFRMELQFDVLASGSVGSTIGVSAGFGRMSAAKTRTLFAEGEAVAKLMTQVEHLGLSDARWHLIANACFSKLVETDDGPLALSNMLTFLKLRVRDGEPLDAKAYLQAGVFCGPVPLSRS